MGWTALRGHISAFFSRSENPPEDLFLMNMKGLKELDIGDLNKQSFLPLLIFT
jgi:hypothetical protein